MSKHTVTSFSYPIKELETVEEAERLAKADGKSLSQLILRLLKEEINQKKVVGHQNPLNITYSEQKEKPLQCDIRQFLRRNDIIMTAKDLKAEECEIIAKNLLRVSRFKRTGVIEV